jgi:hypothetical protein
MMHMHEITRHHQVKRQPRLGKSKAKVGGSGNSIGSIGQTHEMYARSAEDALRDVAVTRTSLHHASLFLVLFHYSSRGPLLRNIVTNAHKKNT